MKYKYANPEWKKNHDMQVYLIFVLQIVLKNTNINTGFVICKFVCDDEFKWCHKCHGSLIPCFLLVSCSLLCVCVSVRVGVPTDQRWSTSQRSSSTPAAAHHTTLYILTTLSSPLSDRCLLSWMLVFPSSFLFVFSWVCALRIRHGTSGLLFTALSWPSKSLRHYPGSVNLHLSSSLEV